MGFRIVQSPASPAAMAPGMVTTWSLSPAYDALSHAVQQGTREFGIRMALGAVPGSVVRQSIARGLVPVVTGIVAGMLALPAGQSPIASELHGVDRFDGLALGIAFGVFGLIALAAALIAARRASRVDPSTILKHG